jgi:hypothetical protein
MSWFRRISVTALILCLCVVVFGAYVRLSDAGLGCPDWPGCYGHIGVPAADHEVSRAEARFPERPVEAHKAWKEMIHRYLASTGAAAAVALGAGGAGDLPGDPRDVDRDLATETAGGDSASARRHGHVFAAALAVVVGATAGGRGGRVRASSRAPFRAPAGCGQ